MEEQCLKPPAGWQNHEKPYHKLTMPTNRATLSFTSSRLVPSVSLLTREANCVLSPYQRLHLTHRLPRFLRVQNLAYLRLPSLLHPSRTSYSSQDAKPVWWCF